MGKGVAREIVVLKHELDADAGQQFEGLQGAAHARLAKIQQLQRSAGIGETDKRRDAGARTREQLQRRRGDHPERSLRADHQPREIIAGVVLAQLGETGQNAPVGQHRLDAQREIARGAISDHMHPAGVGREIAANRAGALGSQRKRKIAVDRFGRGLRARQRDAGVHRHGVAHGIDIADLVESC